MLNKPLVIELLPIMATLRAHPHHDAKTPDALLPSEHPLSESLPQLHEKETHHSFLAAFKELHRLRHEVHEYTGRPVPAPRAFEQDASLLIDILRGHPLMTLQHLFATGDDQLSRHIAAGAQDIIRAQSNLRWIIMGHTHQIWQTVAGSSQSALTQTYFNVGTWGTRLSPPQCESINEQLLHWLQHPIQGEGDIPLQDKTTTCFVRLEREENAEATSADFLVWDDQGERPLRADELDGTSS